MSLDVSMVQAVLFDLDGTLIDTDDVLVDMLTERFGFLLPIVPDHDAKRFFRRLVMWSEGPTNYGIALLDRLGLDATLLGLTNRLRKMKGIGTSHQFRLVEGAVSTVRSLAGKYRLAAVTTRAPREANAFVEQAGLRTVLEVVTTRLDTWRLKPHPAPIIRTADLLGLPPRNCLMVGDMDTDILAAKRAGAQAAGVLSGFGDEAELRNAGADLIVGSVVGLKEWL